MEPGLRVPEDLKAAEDQGKKRPGQKSSRDQDLGHCKETELAPSRMDLELAPSGMDLAG